MDNNVTIYNILGGVGSYKPRGLAGYFPQPREIDYKYGFLTRSFAKRINTGEILEVDPATRQNPYYVFKQIRWFLTGNRDTVIKDGHKDYGVYDKNKNSIEKLKKEGFTEIESVLRDPLQFWRGY